jgi:hypothetical protein
MVAILSNYTIMVWDIFHLSYKIGGLGNLESKVNPKRLYSRAYVSHTILSDFTVKVGDTVLLPCKVGSLGSLKGIDRPFGGGSRVDLFNLY